MVGVSGEMSAREWTDKQGMTRTSIEVRVNDLTLLGKKDGATQERSQPAQQASAPAPSGSGFGDMDDDIPFNRLGAGASWRVI
jgi:single-strand DNA-binding protein